MEGLSLFDDDQYHVYRKEWRGMPEFVAEDQTAWRQVVVSFGNRTDMKRFEELVGQRIDEQVTGRTPSIWYPALNQVSYADKRYVGSSFKPRSPIYIVSKGRADKQKTSRSLDEMGVRHFVVVEEKERERYEQHKFPTATILVLDPAYQRDYDPCDDLGDSKSKGPGPARNFAWDHAAESDAEWHWVMDDNIMRFFRLNRNVYTLARTGAILRAMEDFTARYENAPMAGPNYFMFAPRKAAIPPMVLNTRIYSCNLILTDAPYRWRGRYNEDTDLSLRMLKDGLCTIQFNAFLQDKMTTQHAKGGNTAEFYSIEGTGPKSEMQVKLHPDVSRVVERWGRIHHYVDYSAFSRNRLVLRENADELDGVNEYGMSLQQNLNGVWIDVSRDGAWTA